MKRVVPDDLINAIDPPVFRGIFVFGKISFSTRFLEILEILWAVLDIRRKSCYNIIIDNCSEKYKIGV